MRTIVFDAGALIAAERGNKRFATLMQEAEKQDATILIPSAMVAETWRGSKTDPRIARVLNAVDGFGDLDLEVAKAIGDLLAKAGLGGGAHVIDANVVQVALSFQPALIVTSDSVDIRALLPAGANVTLLSI